MNKRWPPTPKARLLLAQSRLDLETAAFDPASNYQPHGTRRANEVPRRGQQVLGSTRGTPSVER